MGGMNARVLLPLALLLLAGCRNKDELALQPYMSIPRGSVILLETKVDGTIFTSFPPQKLELILTNECVLKEISDGTVWVSNYHGKRLGFAGRMVKSIELRDAPAPVPVASPKP
jgi:hypothetical protein